MFLVDPGPPSFIVLTEELPVSLYVHDPVFQRIRKTGLQKLRRGLRKFSVKKDASGVRGGSGQRSPLKKDS